MKIIIIGAGIGGLSAGIGLKKQGHQVTVYERVEKIFASWSGYFGLVKRC